MKGSVLIGILFFVVSFNCKAQELSDTIGLKTYTSLSEALKNPESVKRLDLSSQEINLTDEVLKRFKNLEYLSLKGNHLKKVPHGLIYLKKLRILDLSGNDIKKLPKFMDKLKNLEEVYLNDEVNLNIKQSMSVLYKLPKLRSLHLEGDHLSKIPEKIFKLKLLENLYLNNNDIDELPRNIKLPENLKLIDLQMNQIGKMIDKENRFGKGIIIKF